MLTLDPLLDSLGIAAIEADLPVPLRMEEDWGVRQAGNAGTVNQLWDRTITA